MASFKKILENMVDMEVTRYAESKTEGKAFYEVIDGTMNLESGNKKTNTSWDCEIRQIGKIGNSFRVSGYISDWGTVHICLVSFPRTYCDADGSNKRTKHYYFYGSELETFAFDK